MDTDLPGVKDLYRLPPGDFGEEWPDYVRLLSLGPEHVPELIRIATDPVLYEDPPNDAAAWAPIHARRALGQLHAVSAVRPLVDAMDRFNDYDDFWTEELSSILAMIGPRAIPDIAEKLQEESADEYTRIACGEALERLARDDPERREECVGLLVRQLSTHDPRTTTLNAFIVSSLVDLRATEAAGAIERAFADDVVEEDVAGDWEWNRFRLGLGPEPMHSRYNPRNWRSLIDSERDQRRSRPDLKKLKKRLKEQRKPRKRNQRR